ncbi:BamA/TamA family outer membrane protein [bacterium]|nr:BamA/TamA family outer membrane protein [bacterium]
MNKLIKILLFIIFINVGLSQNNSPRKINNVNLIGVESFDKKQISNTLRIHQAGFLKKMDFDRRLIKLDAINIKTFYVSEGFLGVIVKDSVTITKDFVDVYFIISEGKQYFIRSVTITGNKSFSQSTISKILGLKLHKAYNPVKTNSNYNLLEDHYRKIGKLFATINISDAIMDSADINILISEGSDVYINNTYLTGLGIIDTLIIQRELLFNKGDKYNQSDIHNSQRQLLQTGIFSVANITPVKLAKSDSLVNLLVELRPFKQHEWLSEGGYYPIEYYEGTEPVPGAGVLTEWRNRSLIHSGTSLSLKLSGQTLISNNTLNPKLRFDISLANPWLYKFRIPTRTQIYLESFKDYISLGAPYVTRYGIELINTYFLDQIERRSYIETRLYLDRFSRKDYLQPDTTLLLNSMNGSESSRKINVEKHSFEINLRVDKSDNILYPTNGFVYLGQLNRTGGILGGNRDFFKLDFGIRGYQPIYKDIILAGRIQYGMIIGWNADYHDYLYDKFYLGGSNSLRGWDMLRYRTDSNNLPVGDIIRILNNWEIRFPLFWILGGEIFVDGGHIYDSYENISLSDISWDSGFGMTLATPLGPVRLDVAHPIEKNTGWQVQLGVQYIF